MLYESSLSRFWVATQHYCAENRCVTTQQTAAKETSAIEAPINIRKKNLKNWVNYIPEDSNQFSVEPVKNTKSLSGRANKIKNLYSLIKRKKSAIMVNARVNYCLQDKKGKHVMDRMM